MNASGSTDPGLDIVSYAWDTDNDGVYDDLFGATVNYTPPAAGTFTIAVRVTDDDGAWGSDSSQIVVTAILLGDANGDRVVDNLDAAILAAHWHQAGGWAQGDFNADGVVNDKDASIMAAHWHAATPGTLLGDANVDGVINNLDAAILAAHWHQAGGWIDGDFNGDGLVDDRDASIMAAHWGESTETRMPVVSVDPADEVPTVAFQPTFIGPRQASASPASRRPIEPYHHSAVVLKETLAQPQAKPVACAHDAALAEGLSDAEWLE